MAGGTPAPHEETAFMARHLAIDWDAREVRFVLATVQGRELRVDAAGAAPLGQAAPGERALQPMLGEVLAAALSPLKLGRMQALVGVDRTSIEVLDLTLPPAQDVELPELVRNQSLRESSAVSEDSLLDFVSLDGDAVQPRRVLAAAMSAEQVAQIRQACAETGVTPARIVLRPYAAASLFVRLVSDLPRVSLLVTRLADEADLTVLANGRVAFWRTVRLPGDADEEAACRRLLSEISRTSVVVQNQPGCGPIERMYILGADGEHAALLAQAADELPLAIHVVDPFAVPKLTAAQVPDCAGATRRFWECFWMKPRASRRPSTSCTRAAVRPRRIDGGGWRSARPLRPALGLFGYSTWSTFAEVNAENRLLAVRLKELDDLSKRAAQQQATAAAVREWNAGDVVWLDELRDLSLRFPKARDAVVLQMSFSHARAGGGTIDLQGVVRDPAIVGRMERNLRDEFHEVRSKGVKERVQDKGYSWHFESSVSVAHREKNQYESHLPPRDAGREKPGAAAQIPGKAASVARGG